MHKCHIIRRLGKKKQAWEMEDTYQIPSKRYLSIMKGKKLKVTQKKQTTRAAGKSQLCQVKTHHPLPISGRGPKKSSFFGNITFLTAHSVCSFLNCTFGFLQRGRLNNSLILSWKHNRRMNMQRQKQRKKLPWFIKHKRAFFPCKAVNNKTRESEIIYLSQKSSRASAKPVEHFPKSGCGLSHFTETSTNSSINFALLPQPTLWKIRWLQIYS